MSLGRIKACIFDAYGTLFDLGAMAEEYRPLLGEQTDSVMRQWRRKQLEISWLPLRPGQAADFWSLTNDALEFVLDKAGLADQGLAPHLMAGWQTPPVFADVGLSLQNLRSMGLRTAILSNGTRRMIEGAVIAAGLSPVLDAVLSVEEVGRFKPDPLVYCQAMTHFGVEANDVCFVSGNPWDVHGAAAVGFQVVWINRTHIAAEQLPVGTRATIASLAELPAVLGGQ
ncbi:MAG: haloacid dehalogenase type II [Magnetospirillum sp.]|nr:haloacid dehalogenase type II [Magnetospirillum sp.]